MKRKLMSVVLTFALAFAMMPASIASAESCSHSYELVTEERPACCYDYPLYLQYVCSECGDIEFDYIEKAVYHDLDDNDVCILCGTDFHECSTYEEIVTPATKYEDGEVVCKCECGEIIETLSVEKYESLCLDKTEYTYDGKQKTPRLVLADGDYYGHFTPEAQYYTVVKDPGRTDIGEYAYTVTFKEPYSGTEVYTFRINPVTPKLTKVTTKGTSATVTWKNTNKQNTGYEVMYSTSSSFKKGTSTKTKTVKGASKTSLKLTGLKANKTYYVNVRAYKTVDQETFYSDWSSNEKNFLIKKELKMNKAVSVSKNEGEYVYSFTAPKAGYHIITVNRIQDPDYVFIEKSNGNMIGRLYGRTNGTKHCIVKLKKNQVIHIEFNRWEDVKKSAKTTLKVSSASPIKLADGNAVGTLNTKNMSLSFAPQKGKKNVTVTAEGFNSILKSVKKVTIAENVTTIAYPAFYGASSLKEVSLPETLKKIEMTSFAACESLEKIAVPPSVKTIDFAVFSRNTKIYGEAGSAVQTYAKQNRLTFEKVLDSPVVKVAKKSEGKAMISWKKVKSASKYEVWRKTGKSGTYKKVGTTKNTSYVNGSLKKGTAYYYKVKAIYTKDPYKNSFFSKEKKYVGK